MEDVSASSKFKMRSTKDGIEPVVIALILGIVTVGDLALDVNGMALPSRIRLAVLFVSESRLHGSVILTFECSEIRSFARTQSH